jgi:hypothetical protein
MNQYETGRYTLIVLGNVTLNSTLTRFVNFFFFYRNSSTEIGIPIEIEKINRARKSRDKCYVS